MKCKTCQAVLTDENVVGEWIKCPHCGSTYLADHANTCQRDAAHVDYYFPARDSFHDFQTACLDKLMKVSPADAISGSKETGKTCCYIPAIANIGGKGDYNAFYIGNEAFKYKNATNEILGRYISNNDSVFGYHQRKKLKANELHTFDKVDLNEQKYKDKVGHGDIVTNEVHYFPFYYWELIYNGKTMYFMSLGNSNNIVHCNLPIENKLREKARPVYVDATECENHALILGYLTLMAFAAIVIYFYVYPAYGETIKQWLYYAANNPKQIKDMCWVLLIIGLIALFIFPLIIMLLLAVLSPLIRGIKKVIKGTVKFIGFWVAQLFARILNLYKRHKYIRLVMPIQKKKQSDAKNKFGIILNDLHINKEMPPFSFIF